MSEPSPARPTRKAPSKEATPAKNASPARRTTAAKKTASAKTGPAKRTAPKKKSTAAKSVTAKKTAPAKKTGPVKKTTAGNRTAPAKKATGDATRAAAAPFTRFFKRSQDRARRIINDPEAIREAAEKAANSSAGRSGPFAAVLDDFRTLIRLCVAYSRGHYRDIPADQLVIVVGGLIYVVSPLDLIPDVLPGGFVDDAFVVGWVVKTVRSEIDAFREWELGSSPS